MNLQNDRRQAYALPLAARNMIHLAPELIAQAQLIGNAGEQFALPAILQMQRQIVPYRHGKRRHLVLAQVGPVTRQLLCRPLAQFTFVKNNVSGPRSQTGHSHQQRAFACAVWPYQMDHFTRTHLGAKRRQTPRFFDIPQLHQKRHYFANAPLMAATSSGSSGVISGEKRWITWPSLPSRNFSKFHKMSPTLAGARPLLAIRS